MADCECLEWCTLFKDRMADRPATAEMYRKSYCLGNNVQCARYIVFSALGREAVPADLFPNQTDRAYDAINTSAVRSR